MNEIDIVSFYEGTATDHEGRTLADMHAYPFQEFEARHNFIQWMFPLHEKSYHAKVSPVVTPADIERIRKSDVAIGNMRESYRAFRKFLGIEPLDEKRQKFWAHDGNHNLLRITRAIRSLRLFGLEPEAGTLIDEVWDIAEFYGISPSALSYWKRAYERDIWESMTDKFLDDRRIEIR